MGRKPKQYIQPMEDVMMEGGAITRPLEPRPMSGGSVCVVCKKEIDKCCEMEGEGIGMVNGPPGSNQTTLFAKAFNTLDVSGGNSFYAFTSNGLTPNIRVATTGVIQARADPATNTLFIDGPVSNPYIVSTGQYGFYQVKVTPQASTVTSSLQGWDGDFITANSPSTLLRLIGLNDIKLSTNVTTNAVFFSISTFTSQGYLNISTAAGSAYPNAISTVSSLYTPLTQFNSTIASFSSFTGFSFSSVVSSVNALAMSTGENFYTLTGLINARATIIQLNSEIANVNRNMRSTVQGLGSAGYLSTSGGIFTGTFANVIKSTLGGNGSLYTRDTGSYFLLTVPNPGYTLSLPSPQTGWNVVLKSLTDSSQNLTVNTTTPFTLTPGSGNTIISDGSDFYKIY
jgi:hypothetical protein